MTRQEYLRGVLESPAEQAITVEFVKRTTGEVRTMRLRPYNGRPGKRKYNPVEKGLVVVWDEDKGAVRSVPLDGIKAIFF